MQIRSIQAIVVIIIRSLSLYYAVMYMPFSVSILYSDHNAWTMWGLVTALLLLWVFAIPLAKLMTFKLPEQIQLPSINYINCYSIAILLVGLNTAINYFGRTMFWAFNFFKKAATSELCRATINFQSVLYSVVPFFIGLMLIFNAWRLAKLLLKGYEVREAQE